MDESLDFNGGVAGDSDAVSAGKLPGKDPVNHSIYWVIPAYDRVGFLSPNRGIE